MTLNESILNKIKKHVAHDDYLNSDEISLILKVHPEFKFSGQAYRILLFSNPTEECSVRDDSSFSKSIGGINHYFFKQDLDYYPFLHFYQVSLIGLDLCLLLKKYNLDGIEMIKAEDEIVALEIYEQNLLFNGKSIEFNRVS